MAVIDQYHTEWCLSLDSVRKPPSHEVNETALLCVLITAKFDIHVLAKMNVEMHFLRNFH